MHFPTWKLLVTVAVLLIGSLYALPNLFSEEQLEGIPAQHPGDLVEGRADGRPQHAGPERRQQAPAHEERGQLG